MNSYMGKKYFIMCIFTMTFGIIIGCGAYEVDEMTADIIKDNCRWDNWDNMDSQEQDWYSKDTASGIIDNYKFICDGEKLWGCKTGTTKFKKEDCPLGPIDGVCGNSGTSIESPSQECKKCTDDNDQEYGNGEYSADKGVCVNGNWNMDVVNTIQGAKVCEGGGVQDKPTPPDCNSCIDTKNLEGYSFECDGTADGVLIMKKEEKIIRLNNIEMCKVSSSGGQNCEYQTSWNSQTKSCENGKIRNSSGGKIKICSNGSWTELEYCN